MQVELTQIENELLEVVFGMEKSHQHIFGIHVTVQSDPKPLEMIMKKPLPNASNRLQRLLLRFKKYGFELIYNEGLNVFLADTLSKA